MWMQILAAAGLPVIGDRFPLDWEAALGPANPYGFFESTLRDGIHFGTNPDPRSGVYLHPDETRMHAVKVFPEGLVRSDLAFFDRVLVTVRPWHEYARSLQRLLDLENKVRGWKPEDRPPTLCGASSWWDNHFSLVRDVAMRRYRVHFQALREVLERPDEVVPRVLAWICDEGPMLESLDVQAAIDAVQPARGKPSTDAPPSDPGLPPEAFETFDALCRAIEAGNGLDEPLLQRMNALHEVMGPRIAKRQREALEWLEQRAADGVAPEPLSLCNPPVASASIPPEDDTGSSWDSSTRPRNSSVDTV